MAAQSTTIALDTPRSLSKWIITVALLLTILSAILVSAATNVRRCEVVRGDFGSDFSADFAVKRTVCGDVPLARAAFDKVQTHLYAALAAFGSTDHVNRPTAGLKD